MTFQTIIRDQFGAAMDMLGNALQTYLDHGRSKCRARLETLTDAMLTTLTRIRADWSGMTEAGLLLYNMRHIQEHAAQLSLFLGQQTGSAPGWVGKGRP
ncbi:MAG TPA: hypothetical protein VMN57_05215 [Anaerolineales bacterium]|nr:hypothetical protein [Anaerolineales bacterium]